MPVLLMVACVAPFATPPRLQLGYACSAQALNRSLALPVVAASLHAAGRGRAARDILPALARAAGCPRSPARSLSLKSTAGALLLPCLHAPSQPCVRGRPAAAAGAAGGARAAGAGAAIVEAMLASLSLDLQAGLDPDPDACTQEDSCSATA